MKTDYELSELDMEAVVPEGEKAGTPVKDIFCDDWSEGRNALLLLQGLFSKRPIINLIIGFLIEVGDKIKDKMCPPVTE